MGMSLQTLCKWASVKDQLEVLLWKLYIFSLYNLVPQLPLLNHDILRSLCAPAVGQGGRCFRFPVSLYFVLSQFFLFLSVILFK